MANGDDEMNFLDVVVNPEDSDLDIVAVHGLNPFSSGSNALSTWTASRDGEDHNWLTEFLPKRLPKARIMIFGYNSNAVFNGSSATTEEQTDNLLNFVRQERMLLPSTARPLIFICHSLGGLIVKRALVKAHGMDRHKDIYRSTKVIVFFATPHGGSDKVVVGNIAAKVARALWNSPDPKYLKVLSRHDLCAQQNRRDFLERADDFKFITVAESKKTKGVMVVEKDDACLHLSSTKEVRLISNEDHIGVCQFWDSGNKMLQRILNEVVELADNALKSMESSRSGAASDIPLSGATPSRSLETHDAPSMTEPNQPSTLDNIESHTNSTQPGASLVRRESAPRSEMDIEIPMLGAVMSLIGAHSGGHSEIVLNDIFLPVFVKSFEHYDYRADLNEIVDRKLLNTCDWIFETEELRWWAGPQAESNRILWFTGNPGIGKTTLASHVVENILEQQTINEQNTLVLYSFCHYQKNYTASMVLAVAIHQMLRKYPSLQRFAFRTDVEEGLDTMKGRILKAKHRKPWPLWRLLNAMISHSGMQDVILVIDGFNVLEESCQEEIIKFLKSRASSDASESRKPRLKLLITSIPDTSTMDRQYEWCEKYPDSLKHVKADEYEKQFSNGIENLISRQKRKLVERRGYTPEDLKIVEDSLATYEHKSFLPVTLYFKHLEANSVNKAGEVLNNVSLDLSKIYAELVSRLPEEVKSTHSPLATFVTYTYTALDLQELAFVCKWHDLGLDEEEPFPAEAENPLEPQYIHHVEIEAQNFFPMLNIRDDKVSFFHDSIREFILARANLEANFLATSHREAHTQLALLCMKTILYKSKLQVPETWASNRSGSILKPTNHVFLSYAMRYWLRHLQEAVPNGTRIENISDPLRFAVKAMVELWNPQSSIKGFRAVMLDEFNVSHDFGTNLDDLTPLEVLSAVGLEPFLRLYVERMSRQRRQRLAFMPTVTKALQLSIRGGHHECFDFLERTFNITSLEGRQYNSVLQDSALRGDPRTLGKVLRLRRSKVKDLVTALIAAFLSGHEEAMKELIKDHAIFRDRDHFGMNALHALFAYNHDNFGKRTVKTAYDDSENGSINECLAICEYLISNGVNPAAQDLYGHNALHWACRNGTFCHRRIIELLVRNGASVHDRTFGGLTAFHLASYFSPSVDVLEYLIELGTKDLIGMASEGGMTPLHWAITRKDADACPLLQVLEYLLRQGADIRAENARGISALEWGGKYRRDTLQAIYSGLQGVDLIAIRYFPSTGTAVLWAVWSDVGEGPLGVNEQLEGGYVIEEGQVNADDNQQLGNSQESTETRRHVHRTTGQLQVQEHHVAFGPIRPSRIRVLLGRDPRPRDQRSVHSSNSETSGSPHRGDVSGSSSRIKSKLTFWKRRQP